MKVFDIIFKSLIILSLVAMLYIFNDFAKNGRYQFKSDVFWIIDTRSGDIYLPKDGLLKKVVKMEEKN